MNYKNVDEKINYLLAEIDRLSKRVKTLENVEQIVVDTALDEDSHNPVENSAVTSNLATRAKCDGSNLSGENVQLWGALLGVDDKADKATSVEGYGILDAYTKDEADSLLSLKASDASVVHNTGTETIAGTKTFSNTIKGSVDGNSATATKLSTARTIAGASFDGTANVNINFANLSNKPTTLDGYGIADGAGIDASNLSSTNITSWKSKLGLGGKTLLWSNPSPSSDFGAQTITLSSSDYDFLEVVANCNKASDLYFSKFLLKGHSGLLNYFDTSTNNGWYIMAHSRTVTRNSDVSFSITANIYARVGTNTSSTAVSNRQDVNIPIAVYGWKL
jgi:hypothetical protein